MAKTICLRCHGNGYIKVMDSMENQHQIETIYQCPQCNSQGEVMIDESRFKNIQKERDLLSVAHIRKLEEEIDMLRKQKIYLQSKLREKESNDKRG
jgi:RecJ-like exonuclease